MDKRPLKIAFDFQKKFLRGRMGVFAPPIGEKLTNFRKKVAFVRWRILPCETLRLAEFL